MAIRPPLLMRVPAAIRAAVMAFLQPVSHETPTETSIRTHGMSKHAHGCAYQRQDCPATLANAGMLNVVVTPVYPAQGMDYQPDP
jgi:hypothetical protein